MTRRSLLSGRTTLTRKGVRRLDAQDPSIAFLSGMASAIGHDLMEDDDLAAVDADDLLDFYTAAARDGRGLEDFITVVFRAWDTVRTLKAKSPDARGVFWMQGFRAILAEQLGREEVRAA